MLEFPTMAERAIATFEQSEKTISLTTIALKMGATRTNQSTTIVWMFDDDTTLRVNGRGKGHCYEALLP